MIRPYKNIEKDTLDFDMASTHQLKVQDIFSVKDYVCLVCTLSEPLLPFQYLYFVSQHLLQEGQPCDLKASPICLVEIVLKKKC